MAYYGTIPEAPDIRQQRPGYFNKSTEFPTGPAYPEGFTPPALGGEPLDVPDLWPQIEAELKGIIERGPGHYYTGTPDKPLTKEQEEHNKMLMAWKSPAGLSAIETGKYREFQQREAGIAKAQDRVNKIEAQLIKLATSKEKAPKTLMIALEKRYNQAVKDLEKRSEEDSGYPLYTGEGKLKIEGYEEPPGKLRRAAGYVGGLIKEGGEAVVGGLSKIKAGGEGILPPEAHMVEPGGNLFKVLTALTAKLVATSPEDPASTIEPINKATKDPIKRADLALEKLSKTAPDDPEVKQLKQALTAAKAERLAPPPIPSQVEEGLPITERFRQWQKRLPSNQQYIEGGGMPGALLRGLGRGIQPVQQPMETINTLDDRVRQAMERR